MNEPDRIEYRLPTDPEEHRRYRVLPLTLPLFVLAVPLVVVLPLTVPSVLQCDSRVA